MHSLRHNYFQNKFGKGQNTKNIKGYKDCSQFLSHSANIVQNVRHTLTLCLLSSYNPHCPENKDSQGSVKFLKTCIFPKLLFATYTHIVSQIVGGSEIKIASFFAGDQYLMRKLSCLITNDMYILDTCSLNRFSLNKRKNNHGFAEIREGVAEGLDKPNAKMR